MASFIYLDYAESDSLDIPYVDYAQKTKHAVFKCVLIALIFTQTKNSLSWKNTFSVTHKL